MTANHLYQDWIYSAGSETQKQKRTELPDSAKKLFAVWRDIANATKHWSLNQRSQNRQIVDKISEPQIADWYSYFITGPVIYVEVEGALPSITELAELTVQCFNWLLLQEDTDFPSPLDESIKVIFKPISSPPAEV